MSRNRITRTAPNLESTISDESLGKKKGPRFSTPVNLSVLSIRNRLADTDGVSAKAVIDGIVKAGILQDDTAGHVIQVLYSQEKGDDEKTIIKITPLRHEEFYNQARPDDFNG